MDATRLHRTRNGPSTGAPVLLLHGWGSSAALMQPIADALADQWDVLNVDLPGHGKSPAPPVGMGVPEHAALVAELIRTEFTPPVTILGHSNGGRIALYMASEPDYAPLIERLILVSPSGITPTRTWQYHAKKTLASTLKAPFQILPEPLKGHGLDWLRHSLVWKALGSSDYSKLSGPMRETFVKTVTFHLDDAVQRITAPTLLFWGDGDTAVRRDQMAKLEARIPDAGLVTIEGGGHYGYLDDPVLFEAATRSFLEAA